jgi:hypothetical protein
MAKIITDKEMAEIIHRAVNDDAVIDCSDAYAHFLEDLGALIVTHFGGNQGNVGGPDYPGDELGWTCGFHVNECVPADGGIYKDYDTGVTWKDGKETQI